MNQDHEVKEEPEDGWTDGETDDTEEDNPLIKPEYLEEVCPGSDAEAEIQDIITRSFLDPNFHTRWKPYRIELVQNKHLEGELDEKQKDFLIRGRKGKELEEKYAFVVENNLGALENVVAVGIQTHETDYNPLGYSRLGVYLCKHMDICIQHALVTNPGTTVLRVILSKYMEGRLTSAIPRIANAAEFIEPTQGYDCHMSALPPNLHDSIQSQFDRSQVYLYEINKLLQPSARPRQAIPYAVVTYTEGGLHNSAVDAKASMKDQIEGNPRLQEIIKAINAKANPAVLAKVGTGLVSNSPNSPVSGVTGNIPLVNSQSGNNTGSSMSPPPGGTANMPLFNVATYQPGAELNGLNGHDKRNGVCHHPGLTNPQVTQNPQLMDVLKKINARLAAEENKKLVSNAQALQGSNVVAGGGLPPGIRSPFGMPGNVGLTGAAAAAAAAAGMNGTTQFMGLGGPRPNVASMKQVSLSSRTPSLGLGQGSPLSGTVLTEANGLMGGMGNGRFSSLAETVQGLPLRGASPVPASMIPGLGPGVGMGSQARLDSLRQQQSALSKQVLDYGHVQPSISCATTPGLYPSVQSMQSMQQNRNMYAEYAVSNLTGLGIQNTSAGTAAGMINSYGAHPLGVSGVGVTSLQHSAMLRGASAQFLKRSFPDNSTTLAEWDKRQKFY